MKVRSILLILILSMNACVTNKQTDKLTEELDTLLSATTRQDEPGASVLIMKGDDIVFLKNYGLSDMVTGEKITANTLFNLGSISKTFVANAILILQERGQLSVEDHISKYFPEFRDRELADSITVMNLLSHTSGLPDNRPVSENPEYFLTAKDYENFAPVMQTEELNFAPGERFEYSNPAFNGLALIIEKVSGQKWQQFVDENIFIPSGMTSSTITDGPHPESGVAHGYELRDGEYAEYDYGEYPTFPAAGNGGVWSSVTELAKYEKAIRKNLFLGREMTEKSRTIFSPDNWSDTLSPAIGCSWFIGEEQILGRKNNFGVRFIYHTGDQGGFRAFYISIPEKDILYTGLFNKPPEDLHAIIFAGLSLLKESNWLD